jgi:hypothetical protein
MQPGDIVLQGVVTGEAGKFDAENDVDIAGADILLEAGAFAQVFGFTPGGRGMAVVVDFDPPPLRPSMGGELLALEGETVGGFVAVLAGFPNVDGAIKQGHCLK